MTHPRQIIRESLVSRLAEVDSSGFYPTAAEKRVFANRTLPIFSKDLPSILVYTRNEQVAPESHQGDGFGPLERNLRLAVEIIAKDDGQDLDDTLDQIAEEIEESLVGWEVSSIQMTGPRIEETEMSLAEDGERLIGAARLTFEITYWYQRIPATEEGATPDQVFIGNSPDIGAGHESDYTQVTDES